MKDDIAKLTESLSGKVRSALVSEKPKIRVTMGKPGLSLWDILGPRVDISLLDVNENPALRNSSLPTTASGRASVAIDLRYMVSFHGKGVVPAKMMGATVLAFEANSTICLAPGTKVNIVPRPVDIPKTELPNLTIGRTVVETTAPCVHITLVRTSLQELNWIWSMLRARHGPALLYQVTGLLV